MDLIASQRVMRPSVALNNCLVLFAEPEPRLRELLHLVFRPAGFTGLDAATLPQALEIARDNRPATILIDMHLPPNGGLAAVTRFRRLPVLAGCQIVAISADVEPSLAWQSRQAGADAYVAKPFRPARLLDLVKSLLDAKAAQADRAAGGAAHRYLSRTDTTRADGYQAVLPFRARVRAYHQNPTT